MNYQINYKDGYFYPVKRSIFGLKELLLPAIPCDSRTHNSNTKPTDSTLPNFEAIHISPRFRSAERLYSVVDTFLIAQKAYASHNMVMPILYCKPMWPMNSTNEGDFYEPGLPIERWGERSKTRVLWAACGIWEVVFVLKHLPQEWSYDSGYFENRFTSPMEAEKHLANYIFEKSRLSI